MVMGNNGCAAPTALWNEAAATIGGPFFSGAMDVLDAIRRDPAARGAQEDLLAYMADPDGQDAVGQKEALEELLTTGHDIMQLLSDDTNLVPVYRVFAAAFAAPPDHPDGRNVVDSSTALLSRLAGHALDENGHEICSREVDPNGVIDIALAHLVTPIPMSGGDGGSDQQVETPLEIIADTIADVNRASPSDTTHPLVSKDYGNISNEVNGFLTDPQRGLEQFYAIVRNATEHQ
jgi:hypothetical protein